MKHLLLLLVALTPLVGMAQENTCDKDTTLYLNNRKIVISEKDNKVKVRMFENTSNQNNIENTQIFEGVYLDGQSSEKRAILSALPFSKKRSSNTNAHFNEHVQGVYLGLSQFSNDFLSFNPSKQISLNPSRSWEIGATLFTGHITLSPSKQWGLTAGLGWGYHSMSLDGNYAFREIDGVTQIYPGSAEEGIEYNKSRLRYFFFRLPLSLEWQKHTNAGPPVYFTAGPEIEIHHGVKSISKVNGDKQTLNRGLNVRPVNINLLVQAGYGNWGFYMRYATMGIFEKNKGPKLYPFSFGLCWFW